MTYEPPGQQPPYGQPQPGQAQPGYQQQPYQQPYQQPGYQQPQPGYQQPGYQQPGYQQPGYQQPYQTPGYQQAPQGPNPFDQAMAQVKEVAPGEARVLAAAAIVAATAIGFVGDICSALFSDFSPDDFGDKLIRLFAGFASGFVPVVIAVALLLVISVDAGKRASLVKLVHIGALGLSGLAVLASLIVLLVELTKLGGDTGAALGTIISTVGSLVLATAVLLWAFTTQKAAEKTV